MKINSKKSMKETSIKTNDDIKPAMDGDNNWYLIFKTIGFFFVLFVIFILANFHLGTAEKFEEAKADDFVGMFVSKILFSFIPAAFFWIIGFLIGKYLLKIKFKLTKKIRLIEITLYLVFSVIFSLISMLRS